MLIGIQPTVVTRKPGIIRLGGGMIKPSASTFTFPSVNVPYNGRLIVITQGTANSTRNQTVNTINGANTVVHSQTYNSIWTPVTIASISVNAGPAIHSATYNGAMELGCYYHMWLLPGSSTTAPTSMTNAGATTAASSRSLNINVPVNGVVTYFCWSAWPSNPMRWTGAQNAYDVTNTPIGSPVGPSISAADYTATSAEAAHNATVTHDVNTASTVVAASWVL